MCRGAATYHADIVGQVGTEDLTDDVAVGAAHHKAVFRGAVLVLVLQDQAFTRGVVGFALYDEQSRQSAGEQATAAHGGETACVRTAATLEFHLEAFEVRFVLDDFDETLLMAHTGGSGPNMGKRKQSERSGSTHHLQRKHRTG
jgi:hypothetical protein